MNLLILCDHDPASNVIGAVRIRKFAENLASSGCSVRVLSRVAVTHYESGAQPAGVPAEADEPQGAHVETTAAGGARGRRAFPGGRPAGLWGRVRPPFGWVFRHIIAVPDKEVFSLRHLFKNERDLGEWCPDVVVVSGPPFSTFFVARRIARRRGVPWIADYRDLWTASTYYSLGPFRRRLDRLVESRLLRTVTLVTTVSQPLADEMQRDFRVRSEVVLNGYDPDDFASVAFSSPPALGLPLRIVYTGEIYDGRRDPEPLFAALAGMQLDPERVQVEFYGNTVHRVEAGARRHGVERLVRCSPRLPYMKSLAIQQGADVSLLLMWNDPGERGVYSGKLFEYLGARPPILMLGYPGGVAADLIRSREAGVVANNPEEIATAVGNWLRLKETTGVVPRLPEDVSRGLTRQEQSERLRQLCADIVRSAGRGLGA